MAEKKDCNIAFKLGFLVGKILVGKKDRIIKQLREENAELKKYINQLDEEQKSIDEFADAVHEEYKREIAELKRLLRLAVEDLSWFESSIIDCYGSCFIHNTHSCDNCPLDASGIECKWKHAEEAMKLLGDDDNGQ